MSQWTDNKSIQASVLRQWEKGACLCSCLQENTLFPLRIKLLGPTSEEMGTCFSEMIAWIEQLKKHDKTAIGYGYTLIEKQVHHRICGKNNVPTHVEIATVDDATRMIGKREELERFLQTAQKILCEWPSLRDWILKNPFQVLAMAKHCEAVLSVLRWFSAHPNRNLYLRQLDIENVDTKFIEQNKSLLTQMLDILLPQDQINAGEKNFEKRYGLKHKPTLVRLRLLDSTTAHPGYTDISVPFEEFCQIDLPVLRCFFTENEINFLSFPSVSNSCVIFGKGYGVELFCDAKWLKTKEIYYWGDIDTHGFNILSMVRKCQPQTQSFLMTEKILLSHRKLWSHEDKPFLAPIQGLSPKEYALACKLQANHWGKGVRMEQERIRFSEVENFLKVLERG